MNDATRERVEQYLDRHPDATDAELCGRFDLAPRELASIDLRERGNSADTPQESPVEGETRDATPGVETEGSGALDDGAFDPIDDAEFTGSTAAVREHYQRADPVLDALENVGEYPTSGFAGNSGWYRYTDAGDLDRSDFESGYRSFRRPYTFERDREELLDAIRADPDDPSWRSMYAITSYKARESLYTGAFSEERRGGFDGGEGLPEYADMRALPFWIDVDLADDREDTLDPDDETEYGADLKARRGDLDPRERRVVERAFAAIHEEVAAVYDLPTEAIAAFDSGGGFYPFGPAAATLPIAERYDDPETRARLFDEFTDRINAYVAGDADTPGTVEAYGFEGILPRVERKVPGAKHLLDADPLLNKNRQTKAPGSIHKSHDVVVTPLRDADGTIDYSPTTVSTFRDDADLRERTVAETRKFADDTPEARACVESLVATLFPEYAPDARDDVADWRDALDVWLADDWRRERARTQASARDDKRRRERRRERREELADDLDREPTDDEVSAALADQQVTTVRQDVFDDVDRIDVSEVVRKHAADAWNTSNRGHETTFDPAWRSSGSGMSCAVPNGSDTFIDNSCNGGGGPVKAYALGTGILPHGSTAAATPLRGRAWGEAIDGLRGEGYDIRVYVPEAGDEYDETPLWALRKAAVALDVCDTDEFVERESDDGGTYQGFPDAGTFNATLDALADAGVDHGREHIDGGGSDGGQPPAPETCVPPEYDPEPFDKEQYRADLRGERYQAFLDASGPHVFGDPPGVGKSTGAQLGAAERDRPYFAAFDKHEKGREAITDPVTPDDPDPFHLKGGGQPVHDCCMDAEADADEGDTPHCPQHGHPADWERMCPVYERPTDDPLRQRYEALAGPLGELGAHLKLGLFDEDEHPWHGGQGPWAEQFDHLHDDEGRPLAERVAGVHEYQLLKSARDGRDVLVDESPRTLADRQRVDVDDLVRAQLRLEELAGVPRDDDRMTHNLRALAGFAERLAHSLARDETGHFDTLDAPDLQPVTFDRPVDPTDLPPEVHPEDVERTAWRDYQGVNSDRYVEHERHVAPVEVYDEPLAKAKHAYNEGLVRQIQDGDDLPNAPFCIDAVLAAAAKAGLDDDAARTAIAVPPILDSCPWCGSGLDHENGARCCGSEECDWHEAENTVTRQDSDRARAAAWLHDGDDLAPGETPALVFGRLPDADALPEDPLVLDATATPEKVAGLYGTPVEDVDVTGDDPLAMNARVTQVLDGQYHAGTIEESDHAQERIQSVIDTAGEVHDRPLFGIRRKLIELFDFPENAEVLVYGGSRGLNRSECDAVVCIGAPHPDMTDLRRDAELLATDRPGLSVGGVEHSTRRDAPNPPIYRKLRYADENGDGLAVPTKHYTGLVGALFREAREKELEQFVHRTRPLLADASDPVDAYLLTNVPTDLPIDEVCRFDELAGDLSAVFPVPDGAVRLLGHARDALADGGPDGFRAASRLVEQRDDGTLANKVKGWHRLACLNGEDVTRRTVRNWIDALETIGLLTPENYEQHAGVTYTADIATSKRALRVLSSNGGFEVAAVRRLAAKLRESAGSLEWLAWAEAVFDLSGDRCGWGPPPDPAG